MIDPIWKEHVFVVMEQAPEVKVVSLLSQVMEEFSDTLCLAEIDAIAAWFHKNYKMRGVPREEIFIEGVGKPVFVDMSPVTSPEGE